MMTDYFIKLPSEADMPTAFADFYQDGELVTHTHDYAIDVVGVIYKPTGNMLTDAEGFEYPKTAPLDGWHVNVRLSGDNVRGSVEAIDELYGVVPNSPSRVFA
jgi:hypothetical protein